MGRIDKVNYYLDIAQTVAERGTCLRRRFGAVIVKNDTIISTGYAGAPRGRQNCCDIGKCLRQEYNIPAGERYELCRSVHAEANAIIAASREEMLGSTLYLACISIDNILYPGTSCCSMCRRLIINAGIETVIVRDTPTEYRVINVEKDWVENDDSTMLKSGY
ncbi:MAG: dCMP deaminase family protein [Clostridia bacterium]|nr:dCMP deaminase family protein [Clostridia bacterium]